MQAHGRHMQAELGLGAFDSLRAEDEPWLERCLVLPPYFAQVAGRQSVVVFGAPGTGKTALYRALQAASHDAHGHPLRLLVDWRPRPVPVGRLSDVEWVVRQMGQVFDLCAMGLLAHLAAYPDSFTAAPAWAQKRLVWFIHRFTQGDRATRWERCLQEEAAGSQLVRTILSTSPPEILYADAGHDAVIAELLSALNSLGLEGVWVMVDGVEAWLEADAEGYTEALRAFLATLSLFEHAGFAFKLFLPTSLEGPLSRTSGVLRRRVEAHYIRWESPALLRLVELRLALALRRPGYALADLCASACLLPWLETVGAASPREWLDQLRPLVEYYLAYHCTAPVDERTWFRLREAYPPRLQLDTVQRRVLVGGRDVSLEELPGKVYDVLVYLYERAGQVVSKAELYFRIYKGLARVPRTSEDKGYEAPMAYEGLMDTTLYRLRQRIEPDPAHPVLLRTVRGHGVRLIVRW